MGFSFGEIYTKAISLFDDPKLTTAYKTNKVQFNKLMYTYLQNAIAQFTNPVSIGMKLQDYTEPKGTMEVFEGNGQSNTFIIDDSIELNDNSEYCFIEGNRYCKGVLDKEHRTVTFENVLPIGQQYAFEQYYIGDFNGDFSGANRGAPNGNALVLNEIKDILARLLVISWAEGERNLLLDIRNVLQDTDFKLTSSDKVLNAKNAWIDQLQTEILQLQNKLAWNIRFLKGSSYIGRG